MRADVDDALGTLFDVEIAHSTVGIIELCRNEPRTFGTGTLVRFGSQAGILTCAHVLDRLPNKGKFGVAIFGKPEGRDQRLQLPIAETAANAVSFGGDLTSEEGPDLAFIPIPPLLFANLSASGTVVDLDITGQRVEMESPDGAQCVEVVAGFVGELTGQPVLHGARATQHVNGLVVPGKIESQNQSGYMDRLLFKPQTSADHPIPSRFNGTSGGGIWRIYFKQDDSGKYTSVRTTLMGVAYWQDFDANRDRIIIGHGPSSIYRHLTAKIAKL